MKLVCPLLLLAALLPPLANAENLARFELTARVDLVLDPLDLLGGGVQPGDTLSAILQYDLDLNAADDDPSPNHSSRSATPPGGNFVRGTNGASRHFDTTNSFLADITNDAPDGDYLSFFLSGDTTPSMTASPLIESVRMDLILHDAQGTALSDDLLPAMINLADFQSASIFFSGAGEEIGPPPHLPLFDLIATVTSLTLVTTQNLQGDFNGDGRVDAADYTVWRDGLGAPFSLTDYQEWRDNYGAGAATGFATAAPEPRAAAVGVVLAAIAVLVRGRSSAAPLHR